MDDDGPCVLAHRLETSEPSFFSLFLGTALVVGVVQRVSALRLALLASAVMVTLAGSGIVLVLPALLVIAHTAQRKSLRRLVIPVLIGVAVLSGTDLGDQFVQRSSEVSSSGSSSYLRLVKPYSVTRSSDCLVMSRLRSSPSCSTSTGRSGPWRFSGSSCSP